MLYPHWSSLVVEIELYSPMILSHNSFLEPMLTLIMGIDVGHIISKSQQISVNNFNYFSRKLMWAIASFGWCYFCPETNIQDLDPKFSMKT